MPSSIILLGSAFKLSRCYLETRLDVCTRCFVASWQKPPATGVSHLQIYLTSDVRYGNDPAVNDYMDDHISAPEKPLNAKTGSPPQTFIPSDDPEVVTQEQKAKEILKACDTKDFDLLIRYATNRHGFINDKVRRVAWQILLRHRNAEPEKERVPQESLPPHKDEDQVRLDVDRSFVYYPNNENVTQIDNRKRDLSYVITDVLRRNPALCYFQGYHDIVQVLLLVFDDRDIAANAASRMSLLRIRDFMLPSMTASISHLQLLTPILRTADRDLYNHVAPAQPYFALAATLTMYAHDIKEYSDIARLFDFLLTREAVMSVYLYTSIILSRKEELLEVPQDDPQMLHFILSKLPQPLDLDSLIAHAVELHEKHPPESLQFGTWSRVSPYSVLKTTRNLQNLLLQTDEECMEKFKKQATQVARQDARRKALQKAKQLAWMYRRPAGAVGVAIVVGLVALWLGRTGRLAR